MKRFFALMMILLLAAGLAATAQAEQSFTVQYYETLNAKNSAGETKVIYGTDTATKTIQELGFKEEGRIFIGWRAYWVEQDKWRVRNIEDPSQTDWISLSTAAMPEGWTYFLYGSGAVLARTVGEGTIQFRAEWNTEGNTFVYYDAEGGNRLEKTSHLGYKEEGKLLTLETLGLKPEGKIFLGWHMQRVSDGQWMIKNNETGKGRWGELSSVGENEEVCYYEDGAAVTGFYQPGEIRLYAQWIETEINVTDARFGADGTDDQDDWKAIQEALKFARHTDELLTVRVPKGTYYISATLDIFSDTNLILEDGATIACLGETHLMLINRNDVESNNPGGYGRTENITVQGGTWDGKGTGAKHNNLMLFAHAKNVTVENTVLKNCCGNHFIEFNGVSGGTVSNVTFRDFVKYNGLNYSEDGSETEGITTISEAMQIDFAGGVGTSGGDAPADNTPSINITVTGCTFSNVMSGVGNHHEGDRNHGITITNNTFTNVQKNCVNLFYYSSGDVKVTGNTATNVRRFLCASKVKAGGNAAFEIGSNIIRNTSDDYKGVADAFLVTDSSDLEIEKNTAEGFLNGVHLNGSRNLVISDNTISGIAEIGVKVVSSAVDVTGNTITDCGQYNIAAYKNSTGTLENNTYDMSYGILNEEDSMTRKANTLKDSDEEPDYFIIYYHETDTAEASSKTTKATYGGENWLLTLKELGFVQEGRTFLGWKIYRRDTKEWMVTDAAGNKTFAAEVPEGGSYCLYPEIHIVQRTVEAGGVLDFYAQWEGLDRLAGDVNEDGTVDGADVLRLMKYLAEDIDPETGEVWWIAESNADVTGDGKVDELDLLRLMGYLAGANVTLK